MSEREALRELVAACKMPDPDPAACAALVALRVAGWHLQLDVGDGGFALHATPPEARNQEGRT